MNFINIRVRIKAATFIQSRRVSRLSPKLFMERKMFESNKYSVWYFNIINKAKLRNWTRKTATEYVEKHHIIPRSIGGIDSYDNLVFLTAKEHYICHLLLTKITAGNNRNKMIYAIMCMSHRKTEDMYRYIGNSNLYKNLKLQHINLLKQKPGINLGKQFSKITKQKMSIAKQGTFFSIDHKTNMSISHKKRYALLGKGYSCIKCNKSFPGSNPTKHFNVCYGPP